MQILELLMNALLSTASVAPVSQPWNSVTPGVDTKTPTSEDAARSATVAPSIFFSDSRLASTSGAEATVRTVVRFRVRASDPEADGVRIDLRNPPAGLVLGPPVTVPGAVEREVCWHVTDDAGGLRHLRFEATDTGSGGSTRKAARLRVLGRTSGDAMRVGDLDGDGALDIVAGARRADIGGRVDAGAVYVWLGTDAPRGAPDAVLTVPYGAKLGEVFGQGIQIGDVTGDGVEDVIVGAELGATTANPVARNGAVHVWAGANDFKGHRAPTASLVLSKRDNSQGMGEVSGQSVLLADVSGDDVLDVIVGDSTTTVRGVESAGALGVWIGGARLQSLAEPSAILAAPNAVAFDRLAFGGGQGFFVDDVTGDGVLDVIALAQRADEYRGEVHVWKGRARWRGLTAPDSTLVLEDATPFTQLGFTKFNTGRGVRTADVSGDGIADVIAGTSLADISGVDGTGAVFVWRGGTALRGRVAPSSTLTVPGAQTDDRLTHCDGLTLWLQDVTGDGIADVVTGTERANIGSVFGAGAFYVWAGGAALMGDQTPTAALELAAPNVLGKPGRGFERPHAARPHGRRRTRSANTQWPGPVWTGRETPHVGGWRRHSRARSTPQRRWLLRDGPSNRKDSSASPTSTWTASTTSCPPWRQRTWAWFLPQEPSTSGLEHRCPARWTPTPCWPIPRPSTTTRWARMRLDPGR